VKNILLLLAGVLILESSFASALSLKDLLSIKPGESLFQIRKKIEGLKVSDSIDGATYSLETEGDVVTSVKIDFTSPMGAKEYVALETKGHCLTQPIGQHIALNRVFFFDMKKQSRYELTPKGMIKSILIQDIPGARANRQCKFSEALKSSSQTEEIKKVK
jgi:hypothetical protein